MNAFPFPHTWRDNSGHGRAFQKTLGSVNADVVLNAGCQALQHYGSFLSTNGLVQGASSLTIGRCACYSVACDAFQSGHTQQIWGTEKSIQTRFCNFQVTVNI